MSKINAKKVIITNDDMSSDKNITEIVDLIKTKSPKIVVFSGAGISTSSGIPDFRSPDGLYKMIESSMHIDNPAQIFELEYFKTNPAPFYSIAKTFISKKYKPTLAHCFVKLLLDKNMLLKNFTQNIDGLDSKAGIPNDKNIECHGHFRQGHCVECRNEYTFEQMSEQLKATGDIKCTSSSCKKGLVKPDIIFFGESLPSSVFGSVPQISEADMAIVMGTSLAVSPFNLFVKMIKSTAPIIMVNRDIENTADISNSNNNKFLLLQSTCDEFVRTMAQLLDWNTELDSLYSQIQAID